MTELVPIEIVPVGEKVLAPFKNAGDMGAAFAQFLMVDVANGDATADTIKAYAREVKYFVAWCHEEGVLPERARRAHIEAYREWLKARGLSASTRQHKMSIVRRFYEAAVKHELIKINPASSVKGGKDLTPSEEKIKSLTSGALGVLISRISADTLSGKRDRALVGLMAIHGLRRIEIHRLDHEDIELELESNDPEDTAFLTVRGKANKIRRVYLRPDTYAALQEYSRAKVKVNIELSGALFLAHGNRGRGGRLSRRALNWIVDKHLNASTLKKAGVSCHALRHTFGTLSVAGGAKVEHLKDAMGHANLETTGIYVRAVGRRKNNPANFIDVTL